MIVRIRTMLAAARAARACKRGRHEWNRVQHVDVRFHRKCMRPGCAAHQVFSTAAGTWIAVHEDDARVAAAAAAIIARAAA